MQAVGSPFLCRAEAVPRLWVAGESRPVTHSNSLCRSVGADAHLRSCAPLASLWRGFSRPARLPRSWRRLRHPGAVYGRLPPRLYHPICGRAFFLFLWGDATCCWFEMKQGCQGDELSYAECNEEISDGQTETVNDRLKEKREENQRSQIYIHLCCVTGVSETRLLWLNRAGGASSVVLNAHIHSGAAFQNRDCSLQDRYACMWMLGRPGA